MAVTFRLSDTPDEPIETRGATPEENVSYWKQLHESNAYFDTHNWYQDRLRFFGLDQISRILDPKQDDTLLEIGCGYGRLLWHLAPLVKNAIGLDLAQAPLAEAESLLESRGSVELHLGDGVTLNPIKDESVTAAYAFTVFQHMARSVALANAREVARVLAPSGRFLLQLHVGDGTEDVMATPGEQSVGYTAAQAAGLIEDAGLRVERVERELLLKDYPAGNVAWWWLLATKHEASSSG